MANLLLHSLDLPESLVWCGKVLSILVDFGRKCALIFVSLEVLIRLNNILLRVLPGSDASVEIEALITMRQIIRHFVIISLWGERQLIILFARQFKLFSL